MENKSVNIYFKHTLTASALAILVSGCAVGTPYQRPAVAMPGAWSTTASTPASVPSAVVINAASTVSANWWQAFGSAELNRLMTQALDANHDLAAAMSRIEQSRAAAGIANAARLPSVDAALGAGKNRSNQSGDTSTSESSQLSASVSYEVDLWGRNAASSDAARARLNASLFDRDAVALVLQADVAANYFQALALKDRLSYAKKNLDAARQVLSLVELRFEHGANTGLEVAQQRTSVLNIQAQIPQLEQDLRSALTALAVLLGQAPQGFTIQAETLAGLQAPQVAPYQPPALLERRPDIRKAEAQLLAANADLNAARAALYPSLKLSASAVAGGVLTAGSSVATSLAASLAQSIFDGGRLSGQAEQSQARRAEVVEQYLQSVLTGLKEVQDNLGATGTSAMRQDLLLQAAREAGEAYRIANVRYRAGSVDLLTVLDSQRTQYSAEDSAVQANLTRLTATVGLYKALGGGWSSEPS